LKPYLCFFNAISKLTSFKTLGLFEFVLRDYDVDRFSLEVS